MQSQADNNHTTLHCTHKKPLEEKAKSYGFAARHGHNTHTGSQKQANIGVAPS
jgi:hypothetical protein